MNVSAAKNDFLLAEFFVKRSADIFVGCGNAERDIFMKKGVAILMALIFCFGILSGSAGALLDISALRSSEIDYSVVKARLTTLGSTIKEIDIGLTGNYFIKETGEHYNNCKITIKMQDGVVQAFEGSHRLALSSEINICRNNQIRTAGHATVDGRNYLGDFRFRIDENSDGAKYLQVINHFPTVYYLYGVLAGEMGTGEVPADALKAQAIAAKCYVMTSMKAGSNYDIGNTSATQVYKGYDPSWTYIINAVDEVADEVLYIDGKLLRTYYASSNGGETNLPTYAWSGSSSMNAGYAISIDDYDFNSTGIKETYEIPLNGLVTDSKLLLMLLPYIQNATEMQVKSLLGINSCELNSPSNAGITRDMKNAEFVLTVEVEDSSGDLEEKQITVNIPVSEFSKCGIFTDDRLRVYWGRQKNSDIYEVYHVRFGHGVGLSQRGAKYRAAQGQDYKEILDFYYPGSEIKKIDLALPGDKPVVSTKIPAYAEIALEEADFSSAFNFPHHTVSKGKDALNVIAPSISIEQDLPSVGVKRVDCYAYVKSAGAKLFSSPSESGVLINRLAYGDMLTVIKNDGNWLSVETQDGMTGFIEASDVKVLDKTAGESFTYKLGYVNSDSVNFREKPTTSSASYGRLSKNSAVYIWGIAGDEDDWYYVQCGLTYGYVFSQYIDVKDTYTASPVVQGSVVASGITKSKVNLRPQPSTNNTPLAELAGGTYILIYSYDDGWYRVQVNGMHGYVSDDYVTVNTAIPISPDSETGSTPIEPQPIGTGIVNATDVRFRTSPNTSSSSNIIELLQRGDELELYTLENNWYYAKHDGKMGYVAAQYVDAQMYSDPQVPEADVTLATGISTATVNFRTAATTSSDVILTMPKNTKFEIIGKYEEWFFIRYNGRCGFVTSQYAKLEHEGNIDLITVSQHWSSYITKTTSSVNFRKGPSTQYSVIEKLSRGVSLEVLAITGEWCLVDYEGTLGFVSHEYLEN